MYSSRRLAIPLILLLGFTSTAAALDEPTTLFIQLFMYTNYGSKNCGTRPVDPPELKNIADRNGVPYDRTLAAMMAAMQANAGMAYDSRALVPEITQELNRVGARLMNSTQAENCAMIRRAMSNR